LHATSSRLAMPGGFPGAIRDVRDLPGEPESGWGSSGVQYERPASMGERRAQPHVAQEPRQHAPAPFHWPQQQAPRDCCTHEAVHTRVWVSACPKFQRTKRSQALRWTPPRTREWRTLTQTCVTSRCVCAAIVLGTHVVGTLREAHSALVRRSECLPGCSSHPRPPQHLHTHTPRVCPTCPDAAWMMLTLTQTQWMRTACRWCTTSSASLSTGRGSPGSC